MSAPNVMAVHSIFDAFLTKVIRILPPGNMFAKNFTAVLMPVDTAFIAGATSLVWLKTLQSEFQILTYANSNLECYLKFRGRGLSVHSLGCSPGCFFDMMFEIFVIQPILSD